MNKTRLQCKNFEIHLAQVVEQIAWICVRFTYLAVVQPGHKSGFSPHDDCYSYRPRRIFVLFCEFMGAPVIYSPP